MDDAQKELREFVEGISGSLEVAVPVLLQCRTFDDYISATETEMTVDDAELDMKKLVESSELVTLHQFVVPQGGPRTPDEPMKIAVWGILRGKRATMNSVAKRVFDYTYESLRKAAGV